MTRTRFILGLIFLAAAAYCHAADHRWLPYVFWGGFIILSTWTIYKRTASYAVRETR